MVFHHRHCTYFPSAIIFELHPARKFTFLRSKKLRSHQKIDTVVLRIVSVMFYSTNSILGPNQNSRDRIRVVVILEKRPCC